MGLGISYRNLNKLDKSINVLKECMTTFENLFATRSMGNYTKYLYVRLAIQYVTSLMAYSNSHFKKSSRIMLNIRKFCLDLLRYHDQDIDYNRICAIVDRILGDVSRVRGRLEQAEIYYRDSLQKIRMILKKDPRNSDLRSGLVRVLIGLGRNEEAKGGLANARQYYENANKESLALSIVALRNPGLQREIKFARLRLK
jgi:tetratricopeptide (TPR) repeat protein